jgi:streptogramin lyase
LAGITRGPDGNLWFTEAANNAIGKITPAGNVTEYPLPPHLSPDGMHNVQPYRITAGPDGNLWFTEAATYQYDPINNLYSNHIGSITPAGVISEFEVSRGDFSGPGGITFGPDGNLWFTKSNANKITRFGVGTNLGSMTDFLVPTADSVPAEITAGPDGNLWFTEYASNKIGKITTAGVVTEYPVPTAQSVPNFLTAGPDGNLWFTEFESTKVGRITPTGAITEFPVSTSNTAYGPSGITTGPDGNLWFTERLFDPTNGTGNKIVRLTPTGDGTEFPIPTSDSGAVEITTGPDGNLWFTEYNANQIGQLILNQSPTASAGGPYSIYEGDSLTLNAGASTDPDGDTLTYSWDVNGDGVFGDATGVNPTLSWAQFQALGIGPGTYTVQVQVDDGHGSVVTSAPTTLTVLEALPTANLTAPGVSVVGEVVPFSFSVTDPSQGDQAAGFSYTINWEDGSPAPTVAASSGNGSGITQSHAFTAPGTYPVQVTVTDQDGETNTTSTPFTVSPAATSTTVTLATNPSVFAQIVTLTAVVSVNAPGAGMPTGNVVFQDGSTILATVPLDTTGTAAFSTSALTVGSHTITASYQGDANFLGSASGTLIQTVLSAQQETGLIVNQVSALVTGNVLNSGNGNSLTAKLNSAISNLNIGNTTAGINQINAFMNQVNALTKSGRLSSAQAQPLLAAASLAITAASGGSGVHLVNESSAGAGDTGDTQPVSDAGQLVTGTIGVCIENADGTPVSADEQARFDDALNVLDTAFAPYGVNLVDVGVADTADAIVQVEIAAISPAGSAADGVLGCTVAGQITLVTGWDWYTGPDPTAIGAGQYDFETIVMHELGHAIGLGHSGDANSVMYPYLAPGVVSRAITTLDLSVLEAATGTTPEPLLAALGREHPAVTRPPASIPIVASFLVAGPGEAFTYPGLSGTVGLSQQPSPAVAVVNSLVAATTPAGRTAGLFLSAKADSGRDDLDQTPPIDADQSWMPVATPTEVSVPETGEPSRLQYDRTTQNCALDAVFAVIKQERQALALSHEESLISPFEASALIECTDTPAGLSWAWPAILALICRMDGQGQCADYCGSRPVQNSRTGKGG